MQVLLYIAPLERSRRFRRQYIRVAVAIARAQRRHFHSRRRQHLFRLGQIVIDGPHPVHVADNLPGSWLLPRLGDTRSSRLDQLASGADPLQARHAIHDASRAEVGRVIFQRGVEHPVGPFGVHYALPHEKLGLEEVRGVQRRVDRRFRIAYIVVLVLHVCLFLPLVTFDRAARVVRTGAPVHLGCVVISRDDIRDIHQ